MIDTIKKMMKWVYFVSQARALLESERNRWSQEKSDEIERRTADYRNDVESTISRLQEELSVSRSTLDKQGREIIALKEVMDQFCLF